MRSTGASQPQQNKCVERVQTEEMGGKAGVYTFGKAGAPHIQKKGLKV